MIVGVMGTALISPLYAIYQSTWQLLPSDISLIYVIYMGGALVSLLFLGRLPDRIGFKLVMQAGLVLTLVGTLLTMVAWNMSSLIAGRVIVGVASSLMTTSATQGLAALSPPGQMQRVAMMTGFLLAFGFGLGPLVGGVMGQWAPYPLVTAYVPTLLLGACGLYVLSKLKLPAQDSQKGLHQLNWQAVLPKLTWPERAASNAFVLTCTAPFLAFGVFGLYAAMSPLFLDKLVPWHGPVVSGTAIAVILFASACVQMMAGRLPTQWCGALGFAGLALSNALLMANLWAGSAALFVLGVVFTSVGHGMCMLAGMSMVNRIANTNNRSGLVSTYLVIGYIGSMLPMMGIGWMADHWGMTAAVATFCGLVMVLGVVAGALFLRHPRMQAQRKY